MDKTGRTVIEFGTNVIRSDLAEMFSYAGPISTSITAGIYDLMFLSYDNNHPFEGDQPQEQWYTVLKNQLGQNIVLTNPVSDLPSSSNWLSQKVEEDLVISENVNSVTAVHFAYPDSNPNTISPRCVAFDKITTYDFGGHYVTPVLGCTDFNADNYDPLATQDDGSCTYPPNTYTSSGLVFNDLNNNSANDSEPGLSGWTITITDGGSFSDSTVTDVDGKYSFGGLVSGTYDVCETLQANWTQTTPSGCYSVTIVNSNLPGYNFGNYYTAPPILGCMDNTATNYDPLATVGDGSCQYPPIVGPILGCTDSSALNYDIGATQDDGSCQYPPVDKPGCMNPTALNYDPTATVDNGHCEFGGGSTPKPKLSVEKTINVESAEKGSTITYTVVIENSGRGKSQKSVLWDTLPEGFTYKDDGTTEKKWDIGEIYKNEKKTYSFNVLVDEEIEPGFYTNTAKLTSINYKTVEDEVDIEITGIIVKGEEAFPKLEVEKTVDNLTPKPGSYITYTIEVVNNGEAVAENITVTDTLPEGFITNNDNLSKVSWNISSLEVGESWEETLLVYIKSTVKNGSYKNVVTTVADNNPETQGSVTVKIGSLPNTAGGTVNFFDLYKLGLSLLKKLEIIEEDVKIVERPSNWLVIPSINVEIPVVLGTTESALERGAWLLSGGSTPDAGGNTAFAAHRYKYRPPHKQTFYNLDKVEIGDSVEIYWKDELYNYTIVNSKIVSPDSIEVLNQTDESTITLITCTPLFSDSHRLVVTAKLN